MASGSNPFAAPARTAPAAQRSAEEFMDGGANVALKFPKEGFSFRGTVIGWSPTEFQQTDYKSGEPMYWESKQKTKESDLRFEASRANPCMQITIDFQGEPTFETWESNRYVRKELPDDDGIRTAYVHGQLAKAISKGRREAAQKYSLGRTYAPLELGAVAVITRGKDVKTPNDMYGFTFKCEWTPAASNPDHTDALMDKASEDPWETSAAGEDEPPF